jgi:hypothetical protein
MSKHIIELSDKELYILWAVACWFDKPFTDRLKYKLAGLASSNLRRGLELRYDRQIEDRIIELGKWLESKRQKEDA